LTAIRKRPPPTSTSHPSVGLQSAYIKVVSELNASAASRLTAPILAALVHPREELERYGYLVDVPDVEGGQRPTEEGLLKVCDRCKVEFIVGEAGAKCWYHWGRARYGKDQGM
jgi:RNA exonuclease 1